MSLSAVIESIGRETFDRVTKDKLGDYLIIGYDESHDGKDKTVLTVGEKKMAE